MRWTPAGGGLALLAVLTVGLTTAHGQGFPDRPIKIIVPFTPGAVSDVNTRRYAEIVSRKIGQTIVIESKPGAGGVLGAMSVRNAPPDGYTLFLAHIGTHALNSSLMPNLPYDPIKDFAPVALLFSFSNILVVPGNSPANNVRELIELARIKPGGLSYGSQGVGSGAHLLGAMLQQLSGAPLVHVPYPGAQEQLVDIVTGRIDMSFFTYQTARPFLADGKMKILGSVASSRRKEIPDIPTLAESGYPDMVVQVWYGLVAPAGTPADVIARLNREFTEAGRDPALIRMLDKDGMDVRSGTPGEFADLIRSETEKWGKVIRAAHIRID